MACKQGFFGPLCDSPCPLGFYGKHCGGVCYPQCSKEICNPFYGCEQSTIIIIQTTKSGLLQTSSAGTKEAQILSRIYATSSEKNVFVVTEDPLAPSVFNSTYLLPGLGVVICLILIAILIQLCKKSKSPTRKTVKRKSHRKSYIQNEAQLPAQEGNLRSYDTPSESEKTVEVYQPLEAEYNEINENIQIHYPCSSKTPDGYEKPKISFKKMPLTHRIIDLPINDIVLEQSSEPPILCAESSGLIVSQINASSNIEDTGAYIDAI